MLWMQGKEEEEGREVQKGEGEKERAREDSSGVQVAIMYVNKDVVESDPSIMECFRVMSRQKLPIRAKGSARLKDGHRWA